MECLGDPFLCENIYIALQLLLLKDLRNEIHRTKLNQINSALSITIQ